MHSTQVHFEQIKELRGGPTIDIITIIEVIVLKVNILLLKTLRFNKGLVILNCLLINVITIRIPIMAEITTIGLVNPKLPALLNA